MIHSRIHRGRFDRLSVVTYSASDVWNTIVSPNISYFSLCRGCWLKGDGCPSRKARDKFQITQTQLTVRSENWNLRLRPAGLFALPLTMFYRRIWYVWHDQFCAESLNCPGLFSCSVFFFIIIEYIFSPTVFLTFCYFKKHWFDFENKTYLYEGYSVGILVPSTFSIWKLIGERVPNLSRS